MTIHDSLGDRMKRYELSVGPQLIRRMPVIIRVDGKAFHTFTRRINEVTDPNSKLHFSPKLHMVMMDVTKTLVQEIQGARFAYTQSDEISILLRDWDTLATEAWFDYCTTKVVSISAAMATAYFGYFWPVHFDYLPPEANQQPLFDARAFNVPREDVDNYFIWRQKDAIRNGVNYIGRKYFSAKQMHGKNVSEVKSMLLTEHGVQFDEYPTWEQRGACVTADGSFITKHHNIPVFTESRTFITKHLEIPTDDDVRV